MSTESSAQGETMQQYVFLNKTKYKVDYSSSDEQDPK